MSPATFIDRAIAIHELSPGFDPRYPIENKPDDAYLYPRHSGRPKVQVHSQLYNKFE